MKRKTGAITPISRNEGIILTDNASLSAERLVVGKEGRIIETANPSDRTAELLALIATVQKLAGELPRDCRKVRENIESFASVLEAEAKKKSPNKSLWEVTGSGLVEASKAVASMAPSLLQAASRIATFFS